VLGIVRPPFLFQWRFDAIVSFTFNLGPGPLDPSKDLGRCLARRGRRGTGAALLEYDHAGGVVLPGLLNRRKAERRLFLYRTY
jgi:lysozyme